MASRRGATATITQVKARGSRHSKRKPTADERLDNAVEVAVATREGMEDRPSIMDRRSSVRYASGKKGCCGPIGSGLRTQWQAEVRDVSSGGLGLLVRRYFHRGTILAVKVQGPEASEGEVYFVRVAHVKLLSRDRWFVGCAFSTPLGEEVVRTLRAEQN
jgi:hypothetical protein